MKSGFYSIQLTGLKEGSHVYDFEINDNFFSSFEESVITSGRVRADVTLIKRSAHMELFTKLTGSVDLSCDRCLERFLQGIDDENSVLVKYGDQWAEVDDEVIMIPYGESELELSQLFYEFVHLALPLQRIHPDDPEGNSTCNKVMLNKLDKYIGDKTLEIDSRWKELDRLRKNSN